MRILNFLKPKQSKRFVSEIDFIKNRDQQSHLAVETLVGLRELNVEEGDAYSIEFWFSVGSTDRKFELTKRLENLGYLVNTENNSNSQWVVSGRTSPMKMMHEVLKKWATDMCALGYEHDCNFEWWRVSV